jgi:uncharacterized protein
MEDTLYRYNPWWEEEFTLDSIIPREKELSSLRDSLNKKEVVFVTGLRRVGKTTLLKLLIKDIIDNAFTDPKNILYVSLDDYLLMNFSILEIIDKFRSLHKIKTEEKIYLFLDEITYKEDYEIQVKNLYDSHNVKIYLSSSSASVMKNRKPYLTGRSRTVEITPLDFNQYLAFKNIKIKKRDKHLLTTYFEEYLSQGGIPEYVLTGDANYLRELVDDIIYKDIAARHNIRDLKLLKEYFLLLMERAGKIFSINKLANILNISPDTARRYLNLFNESYLIHLLPRYGKTNERILSPKKIYAADLGIRTLFTGFRDKGSLFENYIYMIIKSEDPSYLYKDGIEIDFYTSGKRLIEVKYNSELTNTQKQLMNSTKAKEKIVIVGYDDITKLSVK